jgi:hypothetical protein
MKIANQIMKTIKVGKIISRLFYRLLYLLKRIFTIINVVGERTSSRIF